MTTYLVTTTANSGAGSLSDAINQANAGTYNEIDFNIGTKGVSSGMQTIEPGSPPATPLPVLTASGVFINGYSENQWQGVTSTSPLIELYGGGLGSVPGLDLTGTSNTVSGLFITSFTYGIEVDGDNNTIGGTAAGAGNILSGDGDGVLIDSGISGVQVQGNSIGVLPTGSSGGNGENGIELASQCHNITIGGTATGAGNVISGYGYGLRIDSGVSGVAVQGNYIGTDVTGEKANPNGYGIYDTGGSSITIGGTVVGARNIISGNNQYGLFVTGNASGVLVQGNYIGTDVTGTNAVANSGPSVFVQSSNVTIGGTSTAARNIISGNGEGVAIDGSGVLVQGNYIGTDVTGASALPNSIGVEVDGSGDTIGGTTTGAGNLISGNTADGVLIDGTGAQVQGNYIGTDVTGAKAIGNNYGVYDVGSNNTIGGTATAARNVISGNRGAGVLLMAPIFGSGGQAQVQGNYIGTDVTGAKAVANNIGIEVSVSGDTIGGTATGAGNLIADNSQTGVLVDAGTGDTIRLNSIFANGSTGTGPGITLSNNGNNNLAAPSLLTASLLGNTLTVTGTFTAPTANVSYTLDFYANSSTDAEGKVYLGSLTETPTSTGTQSFTYTTTTTATGTYPLVTATLTDSSGDTSPFSNGVGVTTVTPYIVTSTADDGSVGTMRDAINQVNAGKYDAIEFNIAGTGVQKINLTSALPAITASGVFIDGQSENQFQGVTSTAQLLALDGTGAGSTSNGLVLTGSKCIVSGLIVENFGGNGIEVAASNNIIGGTTAGAGNIIPGNTKDGLLIDSGVSGVVVQGNYIGTSVTGLLARANSIGIEDAGSNNTIGGPGGNQGNVISANKGDGVLIDSTGVGNVIQGNFVGTTYTGKAALGNGGSGIEIAGVNNTVGGTATLVGNILAGNSGDGLRIDSSASGTLVQGNGLGMANGGIALGNSGNGVTIAGSNNTIGGTSAAARNTISGNTADGVLIASGGSGNLVHDNYIGTDLSGAIADANSIGVEVAGTNNTVGGTSAAGNRNVISGNSGDGVLIDTTGAGNVIQGNLVGTDYTGEAVLHNGGSGIEIAGVNNTVGGTASLVGNIVAGNSGDGLRLDSSASGTLVQGNGLGMANGGIALGNSGNGVNIAGSNNTLGGTSAAARNTISGNTADGVLIASGGSGNLVHGNYIGTDLSGAIAAANSIGVEVAGSNNTIGGSGSDQGNVISGNSGDGVLVDSTGAGNVLQGNFAGTTYTGEVVLANGGSGIEIAGVNSTVGGTATLVGNILAGNSGDGLRLDSSASGTLVQGNGLGMAYGAIALGNSGNGVNIAGSNNTLGGTSAAARNTISGNTAAGVLIASGGSGNLVHGNYIGTDLSGSTADANSIGILVSSSQNTIGGSVAGASNVISGNKGDGVDIASGVSGVLLLGNYIGTDYTGTKALANGTGIEVSGSNNTIGTFNYISGNTGDGVRIDSGVTGVLVQGNIIGANAEGSAAVANSIGIEVAGSNNTLGASYAVAPNFISGNRSDGVKLDAGSSGNVVLGSYIGTNFTGSAAVANRVGIEDGGSSNTIGGSVLGAKNVISGNSTDGVLIDSTATNETMQSNYIGLNLDASTALANGTNGVEIGGSGNTIGGQLVNAFIRNYISGNTNGDGVKIDSGASGNQVQGNFIGVAVSGTIGVANSVGIEIAGSSNTIGGTANGVGNVISGNRGGGGVLVDSTGAGNVIQNNFVGPDYTGGSPLGNGGTGIEIQGSGNTVGVGNVISGNGVGVNIDSRANANLVQGSLIGLNLSGSGSNLEHGVIIGGNNNTIGGTVAAARNIISGNTNDGVLIDPGASGNQVLGDYIGTNLGGTAAAANMDGVEVAGTSNTVGGAGGARNVISGNTGLGVWIYSGASGNQVLGNAIGVNIYDSGALGNNIGILVAGSNNTLGASWAVAPNEISGNRGDGVQLEQGSSGNVVLGSYIGTDHTGTTAVANGVGIEDGGSNNTIGGSVLGARNVISGNTTDGVLIDSSGTNETMLGNYIGTDYSASVSIANGNNGVEIQGNGNTVGGQLVNSLVLNYISGNSKGDGVKIDSGTSDNQVLGNFIGVDISGTVGLANSIGVEVGGSNNTIGGPTNLYTNVISGNSGDGVLIDSTGARDFLQNNYVGTDYTGQAALGNSGSGIAIAGNNNTVYAGNVIAYNSNNGVLVSAGSGNMIRENSIFSNTGLGISLASGANNNIVAPTISTATLSSGTLTVTGTFTATVGDTYALEFFANPSGDAEGKIFLGSLPVTAASTTQGFTFTTTNTSQLGTYPDITATLTDNFGVGDTSEFSNGVTVSPG